ncbi:hypothetical protein GCM10017771_07530 [Streptomyces capitiformicae]|uniref:Uncharacterized protein n=1 Tax=Streptomyces capitiformicae TaxID=2014920 RepID=A0A919GE21_9ACTN|nr:hypothetical protein GCM10017771_07530 [Streptomyces capitiformicae]
MAARGARRRSGSAVARRASHARIERTGRSATASALRTELPPVGRRARRVPGGGSVPRTQSGWCSGPPKSGLVKSGLLKLGREPAGPLPGLVKFGRL